MHVTIHVFCRVVEVDVCHKKMSQIEMKCRSVKSARSNHQERTRALLHVGQFHNFSKIVQFYFLTDVKTMSSFTAGPIQCKAAVVLTLFNSLTVP
jgi:hypothetical protein